MRHPARNVILAVAAVVPLALSPMYLDFRPPKVELTVMPDFAAPVHTLDVSARAGDDRGIASVWVSLDGDVEAGRTSPPWEFRLRVAAYPVQVCALVTDTSGNASSACRRVEHPAPGACVNNTDCAWGKYCRKQVNDCAGVGVCTTRPEACPDVEDPVCGCDGRTYGNACVAARSGVNVGGC